MENMCNFADEKHGIMCTAEKLYEASSAEISPLRKRKRGESFDYEYVSFLTSCLTLCASRRGISIAELLSMLEKMNLFSFFYQIVDADEAKSKVKVVNKLQKEIEKRL